MSSITQSSVIDPDDGPRPKVDEQRRGICRPSLRKPKSKGG